ncbi:MAG: PAS domain S-box protein [Epsilonproteobacteria bacterium]|nr:PAS domain S-box protein [Campylobacterota bacterium]
MFFQFATPDIKSFYNAQLSTKFLESIHQFETDVINQKHLHTPKEAHKWFQTITKKLDILDAIRNYIKKDIIYKIKIALNSANELFYIIIGITIAGIIIFIFMLIALFKLTKNEQKLRMVMDKYIISSVSDLNGKIINVSEAFCNISGYTKEELIGKNHNIVRHPDTPKEVFRTMWANLKAGNSWSGKIKNKTKDGGFYWVYANIEPLYNDKGIIDSYISIRLDITENELLLEKIRSEEEKNKIQFEMMQQQHRLAQMGEMLSMIAHQWRQPLSAITAASGALELNARLNQFDTKKTLELTEKIKHYSKHLSSTIDDFRNFFKSNKIKTKTNYQEILKSVLNIIESSLEKQNIQLNVKVVSLQYFETYENEIKQVVLNLLKNAEDALVENNISNKKIDVTIDEYKLTISDNAGGIPEEIMEKIFDPYFSTKTKKDGTGLGLYMSKLIIEDHANGTLEVHNNEEGAVFVIDLGEKNND